MNMNDRGQSLVEAILLSLLFLVPMLWALGVLAELHRAALAGTAAARSAGFEAARSSTSADANRSVSAAVATAFENHGLDPQNVSVEFQASGLQRGERIEIVVRYPVTVVQAPLLGRVAGPSIWVDASHMAVVDPYRSRPE